jgi:glucoamylase
VSQQIARVLHGYALLSRRLQRTRNPSGAFSPDLAGLGEPKFGADGHAFDGSWGRPQRDGPALRAIALMKYLRVFNGTTVGDANEDAARAAAEQALRADLRYVARYWPYAGFDVWEEVEGLHFSTAMVQHRALREGAVFSFSLPETLEDSVEAARWYADHAAGLRRMLTRGGFWSDERGHVVHSLETRRSGLDCATLLGALHGTASSDDGVAGEAWDEKEQSNEAEDEIEDGDDASSPFPPASAEVLATLLALSRDMRARHPINRAPADELSPRGGVGLGRYPEDVYAGYSDANVTAIESEGGNPWFLCTLAAAETLHRAAYSLRAMPPSSSLALTSRSRRFYRALLPGLLPPSSSRSSDSATTDPLSTRVPRTSPAFAAALTRLRDAGDGFLRVARAHADQESGAMSEQFDSVTGYMRGARDLGWSYVALLRAARAKQRLLGDGLWT